MSGPAPMARRRTGANRRLRLEVTGAVQGVGFRPFVHRLAVSEGLGGFVRNTGAGATVEVEGAPGAVERFRGRLDAELAAPAAIEHCRERVLPTTGEQDFSIVESTADAHPSATVLPDLAICADCLAELCDPDDRRYRYPFTTCMHCGPRFSVIEALPYDRERTAMRHFPMCPSCRAEYEDPASRRFHAETNACPDCGPQLVLWNGRGGELAHGDDALKTAAEALRRGRIVALKGLGGFQLLVDARDAAAVRRLRERKRRPRKPFALMVPDLAAARSLAHIDATECERLTSPAAPIVLLRARPDGAVADIVAPDNPYLGIMLPTTPLHHLLMAELGFPLVATSGNRGEEPIVTDERQALQRLAGFADLFLVHDRPIVRPVDDSVVRVIEGRETVLRRARGYAPLAIAAPTPTTVLALGGHQKNAVAMAGGGRIVLGPHIGDLGSRATRCAFASAIDDLGRLHDMHADVVACDLHPDYHSSHVADALGPPVRRVPHHLAHVHACMLDNGLDGPVLGVAWDGSGHGEDGTLWGGEFLAVDANGHRRAAHLLRFRLPGGELAMHEPRRCALGALHALHGERAMAMTDLAPLAAFTAAERRVLATMLERGVNAPVTSSAGRLFDAVAALLDLAQTTTFEGEAAMAVEFSAGNSRADIALPGLLLTGDGDDPTLDWRPTLAAIIDARRDGAAAASLAAAFHDALARAIVDVATRIGIRRVLLTGGCFQNVRLTRAANRHLRAAGFDPYWHHRIPPNDGGLAAGQAALVAAPIQGVPR